MLNPKKVHLILDVIRWSVDIMVDSVLEICFANDQAEEAVKTTDFCGDRVFSLYLWTY